MNFLGKVCVHTYQTEEISCSGLRKDKTSRRKKKRWRYSGIARFSLKHLSFQQWESGQDESGHSGRPNDLLQRIQPPTGTPSLYSYFREPHEQLILFHVELPKFCSLTLDERQTLRRTKPFKVQDSNLRIAFQVHPKIRYLLGRDSTNRK